MLYDLVSPKTCDHKILNDFVTYVLKEPLLLPGLSGTQCDFLYHTDLDTKTCTWLGLVYLNSLIEKDHGFG